MDRIIITSWLLTSLFINVFGQQQPQFVEQPQQNIVVGIGEEVVLPCKFNMNAEGCQWLHNNSIVYLGNQESNPRYHYTSIGDKRRGDCSMKISSATLGRDHGQWICQLPQPGQTLGSNPSMLLVVVRPSLPIISFEGKAITKIELPLMNPKRNVVICASLKGFPAADLEWFINRQMVKGVPVRQTQSQDGQNLFDSSSEFEIAPNTKEIACVVRHPAFKNSNVEPPRTEVAVTRLEPTRIVEVITNGEYRNEVDLSGSESVNLICSADGAPEPSEYEWLFRTRDTEQWTQVDSQRSKSIQIGGTPDQIGEYACRAGNQFTNAKPQSKPVMVKVVEAETSNAGTIVGIVIACAVVCTLIFIAIVFMYRRKTCIFAAGSTKAQPEENRPLSSDAEVGKPEEIKAVEEKVPPPEITEENLKEENEINSKEVNGKAESPVLKKEENDKPKEVVYAQLELDNINRTAKVIAPQYEKTEYAEIKFKKDNK